MGLAAVDVEESGILGAWAALWGWGVDWGAGGAAVVLSSTGAGGAVGPGSFFLEARGIDAGFEGALTGLVVIGVSALPEATSLSFMVGVGELL
jgi:hypothetical protein